MNSIALYNVARRLMQPADVIAFSGATGPSPIIKAVTGSVVSHVAMVRQGMVHDDGDVLIAESTILAGRSGAQTNPLGTRLANYDSEGCAWWLPLSADVRSQINWFHFYQFIGACDGVVKYDTPGLFQFFARAVPLIGPLVFQREHATVKFCSGYDVAILEAAGVLRGINTEKVTAQDLIEMAIFKSCVQILGEPRTLPRFNTVGYS
jgi:hypothetical protein